MQVEQVTPALVNFKSNGIRYICSVQQKIKGDKYKKHFFKNEKYVGMKVEKVWRQDYHTL